MKKVVAIIQARMGSTRLPGKVMKEIVGKPMLWHIVNRLSWSKLIDEIVIATTTNKEDLIIVEFAEKQGISCYAGSAEDVLDRYYQVAQKFGAEIIVRITADCPLIDPNIADKIIDNFLIDAELDYASNTLVPTYPDGLDVEVLSLNALEKAWKNANKKSEREHVTPYIKNHPETFKLVNVKENFDLSSLRWTVDYPEDFHFIETIYKNLYVGKEIFLMGDVISLIKQRSDLENINKGFIRDEGYLKSIANDEDIL